MIQAILFDCFGVLYPDTYWTMAREFLGNDMQVKESELHDLVAQVDLGSITRDDLWASFASLAGVSKNDVYERLKQFGGLDKRLLHFIDIHKERFKVGMISNVGQGFLERMFVDRPAESYFDEIILSSEVGLVKPDVRIYQLAAERLGVETSACVFIDDLEKNVAGAARAGMSAIRYTTFAQFEKDIASLLQDS